MTQKPWYNAMRNEGWWLLGALLVLLASIWPLRALQKLPAQHAALQQQWMQVQAMAQEASVLQAQPVSTPVDAAADVLSQWIKDNLAGQASVTLVGGTAVITLNGLPYKELGEAIAALRIQVGAQVEQLELQVQSGSVSGRVELILPEAL